MPPALPQMNQQSVEDNRAAKIRRYSMAVTIGLIVLCNCILLFGVWVSGVNLDELIKTPDLFDSEQDICLRLTWQRVAGAAEPVRLCSEWINLADPSGKPHVLAKDVKVQQGPDGHYYFDQGIQADFRLLGMALFVVAVLLFGLWARGYLVARYRLQLDLVEPRG
ncbi:hypothetical protein [Petrachloros mirabilis]